MKKTYAVLAIVAAAILVAYALIPDRSFTEVVFPLADGVSLDKYDDRLDGGASEAAMDLRDSLADFSCTLGTDTAKFAWCGLLWNFDPKGEKEYRNWMFVDSLVFDIDAKGTDELLVKVWTFDPDVTDLEKQQTFKLLLKEIPVKAGRQRIAIPMEQLYTPDFWYETAGVDPKYNKRHQETVARFEITPGWNQPRGKQFTVKVYSISASGVSNFYFGAVLIAFLILTIIAVGRSHKVHNEDNEKS